MDRYLPDGGDSGETRRERSGRYWKNAANAYSNACSVESPEAKQVYMQIAMAWATLADELERGAGMPPMPGQEIHQIR